MRSYDVLLLASSGMKSSWRRYAHKLGLQGRTVGVVLPPLLPLPTLFSAPPLFSEKSLPPPLLAL